MSNQAGKGDSPRPYSVDRETFSDNWEKIFSQQELNTCAYSGLPNVKLYDEQQDDKEDSNHETL